MTKRSPVLVKGLRGKWIDTAGRGWLCVDITAKVWSLGKFKNIRYCVSSIFSPGAVTIQPIGSLNSRGGWGRLDCDALPGVVGTYSPVSHFLYQHFPKDYRLWVWIEEA